MRHIWGTAVPDTANHIAFALICLGMVLTPGPNMIYLISRSLSQGPKAGLISLGGVAVGFLFYVLCAAFGITALLLAVPYAYDVLRFGGALYLLYLAWQALRPGGRSPFQVKELPRDRPRKLFMMGLMTRPATIWTRPSSSFPSPSRASTVPRPRWTAIPTSPPTSTRPCWRHSPPATRPLST